MIIALLTGRRQSAFCRPIQAETENSKQIMNPEDEIKRAILEEKKEKFGKSMQTLADSPLGKAVEAATDKAFRALSRKIFGNQLLQKVHRDEQNHGGLLSSLSYEHYINEAIKENNKEAETYCTNQCAIAKSREAEQRRLEEQRRQREKEERQRIADLQKKKEERKKLLLALIFLPIWLPFAIVYFGSVLNNY